MKKTKLKYHFKFGMGETILREEVSDDPNDGLPVYSATEDDKVFGYKSNLKRVLNAGDIIIAARGTIGSVNILKDKGGCTQTTMYMKNLGDFNSYYVYYYLLGHRDTMFAYDKTAIPQLTISKFSNEEILLPSMNTQNRIVAFLGSETGKIDNLVDELTKFKSNLQLQKRSLVSECVTKGIPSERDRAYKYSGVEWLGDIPAGWKLSKVKYVAELTTGSTPEGKADEFFSEDGMPWIRPSNLNDSDEIIGDIVKLSQDGMKEVRIVSANSIAIVCIGTLGKVGLCKEDFATNQQINTLTYKNNMSFKYGFYFNLALHGEYVKTGMSVTLPIMNKTQHGNVLHLVPPLSEQQRIADYLDAECAKIDSLIGEIDNQINLLKTYRKSLINKVVTGKVEV